MGSGNGFIFLAAPNFFRFEYIKVFIIDVMGSVSPVLTYEENENGLEFVFV